MRRWSLAVPALALLALLAWSPTRPNPVHAATTWNVTVGTDVEDVELTTYLPHVLTIAVGDTVNWNFAGFHTVTFNAGQPELPLFLPQPNGDLQLGPAYFPFPPGPNLPNGPYDGTKQISSGTPQDDPTMSPPLTLTFTKAGVFEYECTIHPGMHGAVTVVPTGTTLPETPAQATTRGTSDAAMLANIINGVAGPITGASATGPKGSAATVTAGVSDPAGVSKLAFLPGNVSIHAGDLVAFTVGDPYEIHTVTFTSGGMPPDFVTPLGDPTAPGPPTLVIPAAVAGPSGGPVYSGTGLANSGILLPGQSFVLAFDTPGTYSYLCLVHNNMTGTITVAP